MKRNYLLNEREGFALALKQLRHQSVWSIVDLDIANNEELLQQCFEADFDDPIHEKVEKLFAAATVRTVMEKNYIPNKLKPKIAKKAARQHVEILRDAIITYKESTGKISTQEAQKRRSENKFVERVAEIDTTVKMGTREAAKAGIAYGIGALITAITVTTPVIIPTIISYAIISLIPKNIKEKVSAKAKVLLDSTIRTVKNGADYLARRGVVIAQKTKEFVKETAEKVGNAVHKAWDATTETVGRFFNKLRSRL